ncbi:MAG: Crp/Fnr family transcriptional regulator [Oscillospiraceae bacterium]|nr:Crp/Fnr family transcriptional regulator [Clostridia bacterium]MBQ9249740.1 Crp/Fnr family transcriptional regulator [Oscillospiraceae bacterium]
MDYSVLEKSKLFHGIPASELRAVLASSTHHIQCYEKGEIIFHLMDQASRIGIILEGRVEAQKSFPNGSQANVSVRGPGTMIGPAASFSSSQKYPCDVVALEPVTVLMFQKEDLLSLMYKNIRILENFTTEIASATYMLQQRLELLSYSGIAQKAAFWLLTQMRQTGNNAIPIPESVSKWAMLMNVSRPSLHRELKRLEQQGIITYSSTVITIHDEEVLQEVLSQ